jgi:hypothetical protein
MVETGDEAGSNRIATANEDDRNRCGCGHHRAHCQNIPDDDGRLPTDEIGRQPRQPIRLIVAPTIVDGNVLARDEIPLPSDLARTRPQDVQNPQPTYCGGTRSPASLTVVRGRQAAKRLPRQ